MALQVLVPITVLAVYHCFAFVANQERVQTTAVWQKYGMPAHRWLAAHQVCARFPLLSLAHCAPPCLGEDI